MLPCGTFNNNDYPWNTGSTPIGAGWGGQIYPFVKAVGVYRCASDPGNGKKSVSYAYNSNLAVQWDDTGNGYPDALGISLSKLSSPSKTVNLIEMDDQDSPSSSGTDIDPSVPGEQATLSWNGAAGNSPRVIPATGPLSVAYGATFVSNTPQPCAAGYGAGCGSARHSDGSNFLLCDGHVKWLRGLQVSVGASGMKGDGRFPARTSSSPEAQEPTQQFWDYAGGTDWISSATPPRTATTAVQ